MRSRGSSLLGLPISPGYSHRITPGGWEIREVPGRIQPFTLWHCKYTTGDCASTWHVHRFTFSIRDAQRELDRLAALVAP